MSGTRRLPPRPSLEFERKEAKALLRRLRAGDPDAIARVAAQHPGFDSFDVSRARLADAQLAIARECGFASWPRLVRWFEDAERSRLGRGYFTHDLAVYERWARSLVADHRARRPHAARLLAAYVPRHLGARPEEIFALDVTEDEARLAIARSEGVASWDILLERIEADRRQRAMLEKDPIRSASDAMRDADLDGLKRIVEKHPALLTPSDHEEMKGRNLLSIAINFEATMGRAAMQPIIDWLVSQGLNLQLVLDRKLCGYHGMEPGRVRWLLERGADPNWVAPSGIPVLEHALLRFWNGRAVDVLAVSATPRSALWIAAGLGDVDGVRRSLDRQGRPTSAARQLRPDFDAVGADRFTLLPNADDEEILLEAFLVAMLNGRTAVLEYMASRGTPVNSLLFDIPLVSLAVGNGWADVVESLIVCGANLDVRGGHSSTARDMARFLFESSPGDPTRRRIAELCGLVPKQVLAERDARPFAPPVHHPMFLDAIELAADDAARIGAEVVGPENLLIGLARSGEVPLAILVDSVRLDVARLRADLGDRVRPSDDRLPNRDIPLRADAQAVIDTAIALAAKRRHGALAYHLLYALTRDTESEAARLLARYGADIAKLNANLETLL